MTPSTIPDTSPSAGSAGREHATGTVVAFPAASARRFRREAQEPNEPRSEILLFTGVRYERLPDAAAGAAGIALKRKRS